MSTRHASGGIDEELIDYAVGNPVPHSAAHPTDGTQPPSATWRPTCTTTDPAGRSLLGGVAVGVYTLAGGELVKVAAARLHATCGDSHQGPRP